MNRTKSFTFNSVNLLSLTNVKNVFGKLAIVTIGVAILSLPTVAQGENFSQNHSFELSNAAQNGLKFSICIIPLPDGTFINLCGPTPSRSTKPKPKTKTIPSR